MKARTLLSVAVPLHLALLCPPPAPALVIDKPTFSMTLGSHWIDAFIGDPSAPFHSVGDTAHEAAGFMQGMPITATSPASQYFDNVTRTMALQYDRIDSSEKQLGSHRFKTSSWREPDPEEEEQVETLHLFTLDEGGVAFFAWMSYEQGNEAALTEFEAALATLQIKSVAAIGGHGPRLGTAGMAVPGMARLDLLGRVRTTAGRIPAGHYVLRAR